jgi:hypothetical protein
VSAEEALELMLRQPAHSGVLAYSHPRTRLMYLQEPTREEVREAAELAASYFPEWKT